jgi:hypothetical protein
LINKSRNETTPRRRVTTAPASGRRLDFTSSPTFLTPMTSNKFVQKSVNKESESSSDSQVLSSLKDVQTKLEQLLLLHKAQQEEIKVIYFT